MIRGLVGARKLRRLMVAREHLQLAIPSSVAMMKPSATVCWKSGARTPRYRRRHSSVLWRRGGAARGA
jgi:hypothetical protein